MNVFEHMILIRKYVCSNCRSRSLRQGVNEYRIVCLYCGWIMRTPKNIKAKDCI